MSKGITKSIVLTLAGLAVVAASIYLSRSRRGRPGGTEPVAPKGALEDTADAGQAAGDPGPPLVRNLRSTVDGVKGDLARVQKRVAAQRDLVAGSAKIGKNRRRLAEPAGQAPPGS